MIVAEGRVEYVDLRIDPEMLAAFVDRLLEDASDERTESVLSMLVERAGVGLRTGAGNRNDDDDDEGE